MWTTPSTRSEKAFTELVKPRAFSQPPAFSRPRFTSCGSLNFRSRAPLATTCKRSLGAIQKVVQHRQTIVLVPLAAGFHALHAKPVAVLSRPTCALNRGELAFSASLACMQPLRCELDRLALLAVRVDRLAQVTELAIAISEDAVHALYSFREGGTRFARTAHKRSVTERDCAAARGSSVAHTTRGSPCIFRDAAEPRASHFVNSQPIFSLRHRTGVHTGAKSHAQSLPTRHRSAYKDLKIVSVELAQPSLRRGSITSLKWSSTMTRDGADERVDVAGGVGVLMPSARSILMPLAVVRAPFSPPALRTGGGRGTSCAERSPPPRDLPPERSTPPLADAPM